MRFAQPHPPQIVSSEMSALRFAFVGCGGIARHHLKALRSCAHPTRVVAVVDIKRENATEFCDLIPQDQAQDCQVFSSLGDLLSWDRFDAAILMVPHHLHTEYAQACLHGNKHVLLEKPLAHSLKSALVLLEEAERSKTVFMVGEQSPRWPEVVKAQELLEAGTIGRPYHALANYWEAVGYSTFLDEAHFFAGGNWRFDPQKAGGGVLMDGATHWVRPLTMWFGDVAEVIGMVDYPLKPSRCETLTHSLFRFSSGISASLYCHFNRIPMTKLPFFQIFGDEGEITIEGGFDGGVGYRNTSHPEGVELGSLGGFSGAFAPQMQEFVGQIVERQESGEGGEADGHGSVRRALQEVMVAEATYKSVQTKHWETVTLDNLV